MKKYLLGFLAIASISSSVYAAGCTATGCYGVKLTRLYVTNGGTIYIATNGLESALNCTSPGDQYVTIDPGQAGTNSLYAVMLTAQTTDKIINIRVNEGTSNCSVSFATLDT